MPEKDQTNTTNISTGVSAAMTIAQAAATQASANAAAVGVDIKYIQRDIQEIKEIIKALSNEFVTKAEFTPIKNAFYIVGGLVVTAVFGALLSMVIKK